MVDCAAGGRALTAVDRRQPDEQAQCDPFRLPPRV